MAEFCCWRKDASSLRRFATGPSIRLQNLVKLGMGDDLVGIHDAADSFGYLREVDFTADKCFHRNFVRRVHYGGQGAAGFAGAAREFYGREAFHVRLFKGER